MAADVFKRKKKRTIPYISIYAKKAMNARRISDIASVQEQYEKWRKENSKLLDDIEKGTKAYEEFDEWLDKNN